MKHNSLKTLLAALLIALPASTWADYVDDINLAPHAKGQQVIYEMNVGAFTSEGSLSAASQQLKELKRLGVDIVWLMPIYPRGGGLNSPYAATDFKAVNPSYGTVNDLKAFVDRAHALHMQVWLDWVPNHTATNAQWVTSHPDYYTKVNGAMVHPNNYNDVFQLNYANPQLVQAMNDCLAYWVNEAGVDGFRCDYVSSPAIPADYWQSAIPTVKAAAKDKEITFLAETDLTDEGNRRIANVGFNYDYAWGFQSKMAQYGAMGTSTTALVNYADSLLEKSATLPASRMVYLTNHDQNYNEQLKTLAQKYGANRYLLSVYAYCLWGMPMIYNGQEVGGNQPLNYFTDEKIDWQASDPQMTNTLRTLFALKHTQEALHDGPKAEDNAPVEWLTTINRNPNILAFRRARNGSEVVVIINTANTPQSALFSGFNGDYSLWLDSETIGLGTSRKGLNLQGSLSMTVPAKGYRVYVKGSFSDEPLTGSTTSIAAPTRVSAGNDFVYNLQGVRVDANYKGIAVMNGRKFVQ